MLLLDGPNHSLKTKTLAAPKDYTTTNTAEAPWSIERPGQRRGSTHSTREPSLCSWETTTIGTTYQPSSRRHSLFLRDFPTRKSEDDQARNSTESPHSAWTDCDSPGLMAQGQMYDLYSVTQVDEVSLSVSNITLGRRSPDGPQAHRNSHRQTASGSRSRHMSEGTSEGTSRRLRPATYSPWPKTDPNRAEPATTLTPRISPAPSQAYDQVYDVPMSHTRTSDSSRSSSSRHYRMDSKYQSDGITTSSSTQSASAKDNAKKRASGDSKDSKSGGRWLSQIKDWASVSEPSTQALKQHKRETFKRAGIALDDPRAGAKLHIPVSSLPPEAIRPAGRGPDPEELLARKKPEERKKSRSSQHRSFTGTSNGTRSSDDRRSSTNEWW
jgi:hypothetical protein